MLEPVKPLTTPTPNCWAARAVFFISSAARRLTPAGLPSPHTCGGRIDLCRSSIAIAHRLAHQVCADGVALQVVAIQAGRAWRWQ